MADVTIPQGDKATRALVAVAAADGSVPTGNVQLTIGQGGPTPVGTLTQPLVSGKALFPLDALQAGSYCLVAGFPEQNGWGASLSDPLYLVVTDVGPPAKQTQIVLTVKGVVLTPEQVSVQVSSGPQGF